jgi:hypothetical protein
MYRNIIGGMSNRGYIATSAPVATQVIGVKFQEIYPTPTTAYNLTIGTIVWTFYISAIGRR